MRRVGTGRSVGQRNVGAADLEARAGGLEEPDLDEDPVPGTRMRFQGEGHRTDPIAHGDDDCRVDAAVMVCLDSRNTHEDCGPGEAPLLPAVLFPGERRSIFELCVDRWGEPSGERMDGTDPEEDLQNGLRQSSDVPDEFVGFGIVRCVPLCRSSGRARGAFVVCGREVGL